MAVAASVSPCVSVRSFSLWCWRWSTRQGYLVIGAVGERLTTYYASCTNLFTPGRLFFIFLGGSDSLQMFTVSFFISFPHFLLIKFVALILQILPWTIQSPWYGWTHRCRILRAECLLSGGKEARDDKRGNKRKVYLVMLRRLGLVQNSPLDLYTSMLDVRWATGKSRRGVS